MPDNVQLPAGSGGDTIAADEVATLNGSASTGVKVQRAKIAYGDDGSSRDVSDNFPLPTTLKSASPAYRVFIPAQAVGANKVMMDLFNATGSGKVLKIKSVRAIKDGSVAVTRRTVRPASSTSPPTRRPTLSRRQPTASPMATQSPFTAARRQAA
ncbi:hypothetical protein K4H03_20590 [Mycobacterium tuberculosis]|nr:hypothetical protein [Mycobacterium tuberculosis]